MKTIESLTRVATLCERYRAAGLSVGFVPTMGALHEGHVSLIRRARSECDRVVASIFVNPTQFGPTEDLKAYPRPWAADHKACQEAGAHLLFQAREEEIYPPGFQTWVTVTEVTQPLCGQSRPVHFRGVATVVSQLFSIVRPHRAYFGQKDYQQCLVVERLSIDLHLGVEIVVCPTVREPDGLAMSSRNVYLDPPARRVAPRIRKALEAVRSAALGGERNVEQLEQLLHRELQPGPDLRIDYAQVLDGRTLGRLAVGGIPAGTRLLVAVAAFVGKARLIDNIVVEI